MRTQDDRHTVCNQSHQFGRKLHERIEELWLDSRLRIVARTPLSDMADYADDLCLHIKSHNVNMLADGVLVGEIRARKGVINVDDDRAVLFIICGDEAASSEGDAHGLLESSLNQIEHGLRHVVVVGRFWLAFDPERKLRVMNH